MTDLTVEELRRHLEDEPGAVADVLDAAADALMIYGRTVGKSVEHDGRLCVEGAVCHVLGLDPNHWTRHRDHPAVKAMDRYIAAHIDDFPSYEADDPGYRAMCKKRGWAMTFCWNDATHDDGVVDDTLRRCAKELREVSGA